MGCVELCADDKNQDGSLDAAELKLVTQHLLSEFGEIQASETQTHMKQTLDERERKLREAVTQLKSHPDELKQFELEKQMLIKQWPDQLQVAGDWGCGALDPVEMR